MEQELNFTSIERAPYDRNSPNSDTSDVLVSVQNGTFKWLPSDNSTLDNISLKCKRGELVAIIGQVGCGKSSLASAILGEMIKCSGSVEVSGSIAYVPQTPWILNATLRENITFGSSYDESFYNKVIDACALQQDIDVLPTGDMTEIGEKGINLSGGQKARVSLARAVYSRADVYILDDPLAAVDAHVSKHLFTHVLGPQGMLQSRARILVTNAVQYLNNVDNIIMLRDGEIIEHCSFAEAMNNQDVIHKFIHKYVNNDRDFESGEDSNVTSTEVTSQTTTKLLGHVEVVGATSPPTQCSNQDAAIKSDNHIGRTTTDEVSEKGKVQMNVYRSYANACGGLNTVMFSITLMCTLVISIATNMWLKHWASVNDESNSMKLPAQAHAKGALYYLLIYGGLGLSHMLASYLNALIIWVRCLIQASTKIHSNMLISVVRSPVSFFDTTPTGRIINRFASDLTRCDNMVPAAISRVAKDVTSLVVSAIIIGYTTPPMLVVIILFLFVSQRIQRMFLCSSRELRRLESTTGSPIIAQFQETIGGAASIRAYGHQPRFLKMLETRLGHNIQVSYNYWIIKRWLSTRLNIFGNIIVFGTSLLAVMSVHLYGVRDAALVGLAITYAFEMSNLIRFSVRSYTDMEDSMTHVERALEYARLLPESAAIVEDNRSKDSWPEHGALEFKNYSARYRDGLNLALKDLTFSVLPRQKVGIVGRTGAGKSSLSLALFRIIESAGGMILLDGKDISKYGLYDVRSKLSIIPQDPVLFAGTVRENLDPFNNYSDQDIWCALEQAHLADYIRSKDERLEFLIAQSSDNFSIGQRQLVCLARALLKHAKVLVLDEATAAIDNATDEIIQQTIRTEFKDCTVLTIAHRLNTIIDSDMVLVIDNGRIAEYNTPQRLLANKKSLFAKLVEEAKRSD
ncbi:hypothetical protein H4R24_002771 [Coemansia sp. RSA 988]|nr:hypothetical protein H4R24_002771 [Coemansia sp. RSA 988]